MTIGALIFVKDNKLVGVDAKRSTKSIAAFSYAAKAV
jgi:hypothetical protein